MLASSATAVDATGFIIVVVVVVIAVVVAVDVVAVDVATAPRNFHQHAQHGTESSFV